MSNINVIEAVRSYVNQMIEKCGQTMKVLVMDKETVSKQREREKDSYIFRFVLGIDYQYGLCSIGNSSKRSFSFRTNRSRWTKDFEKFECNVFATSNR